MLLSTFKILDKSISGSLGSLAIPPLHPATTSERYQEFPEMASSFNPTPTGRFPMTPGPRQQAAAATGFAAPAPAPAQPPAPQSQGAPTPRMEMLPSTGARPNWGVRPEGGQPSRASHSPPPLPKATLHFVASLPEFHFSSIRRRLLNQRDKKNLDRVRKYYNREEGRATAAERLKRNSNKRRKGKRDRSVGSSNASSLRGGPVRRPHNGNPWIRA